MKIYKVISYHSKAHIMINLISDTVTKPTAEMLAAMMAAEVGDDVFGADPSVNALEAKAMKLFGKEAAVFCPSGTMTNQIAIKMHTQPLDEVICDHYSHVHLYEVGGYAYNAGVSMNLIQGSYGKITAEQVSQAVKPDYDWLPNSSLVVLENSCNKGGGSYYTVDEIKPIQSTCKEHGLKLHLDGARLFNVLVETQEKTQDIGACFDSISICISKGLGAPVGSLLIGDQADIKRARKLRKVMGGGMRQAGYLAAACSYALDHHVQDLQIDNQRAKELGALLVEKDYVDHVKPVHTNIVIFALRDEIDTPTFVNKLKENGIGATQFGPQEVRFVLHRDISNSDIDKVKEILEKMD